MCLKRFVFDPFSGVLDSREARTTGTQATAAALSATAADARTRYDGAVAAARVDLAQQAEGARKAAQEELDRALAAARSEASQTMAQNRAAVAREIDAARQTLLAQADGVAGDMLSRVMRQGAA